MINLLPEPKRIRDDNGYTKSFKNFLLLTESNVDYLQEIATLRLWNHDDIKVFTKTTSNASNYITINIIPTLDGISTENDELFKSQGYYIEIKEDQVTLKYENNAGYIYGITSIIRLLRKEDEMYKLPLCEILDYPSVPVRAVAPTFSWYAGYGRIGFDSQLWGYDEWVEFINICVDNKINQMNMVMYGYWPFEMEEYPETVFRNVPVKIWNHENRRWLTIRFSHPNIEENFLQDLIEYAHKLEVKIFAYVGLNSYNGGYSIKHPEARSKPPKSEKFLNDFDSLCLSYPGTVEYIVECMKKIATLGFDGYALEESEEGFWYCECDGCKKRWHAISNTPGEAKHKANMWLLNQIYEEVKKINPDIVLGIRAFRQPPLEKDPEFLRECAEAMPDDVVLFWAPGLYVPESEFEKWVNIFGKHRIWARDTEANSITSTMGRLYRTFKSNVIRYEDETNEQVIETDIRQHKGSVRMGVHGINGYVFEWYGLPLHLFAHGNYGWGSMMDEEAFYSKACRINFGEMGDKVLYLLRNIITIHESQIPLYTTPFPFQKNKITKDDIPTIMTAKENLPHLLKICEELREWASSNKEYRIWLPHFDKLHNAIRRNAVIYDLVLAALRYEEETDPVKKDAILDEILELNEKDFDIVKEMFFDINPVGETGVKSCMYPYHELKRLIHNIRNPENPDDDIICSGIEALGWLWL
ncbi:MAG: hypothetical protein GXX01_04890 [Clostridiales bacterium]|nr:hypothetical protein [Clostridiales bacterium]